MAKQTSSAGLYGLTHSNRAGNDLWSKNRFNSSFPMALCCWLRDHEVPALVLEADGKSRVSIVARPVPHLFGLARGLEPHFQFESTFAPFSALCTDEVGPKTDVVISPHTDEQDRAPVRALEVKLTVIPDNTTCRNPEAEWAPELVFRPATVGTATLGLFVSAKREKARLREILRPHHTKFQNWASHVEASKRLPAALDALTTIVQELHAVQQPLIVQPVWRTDGGTGLAADAFDVFAWTDFAFLQLVIDLASREAAAPSDTSGPKRTQRAALQMARMLYELAASEQTDPRRVFDEMVYGKQSDKAFAVSGAISRKYLKHDRLAKPAIPRTALRDLFVGDGFQQLSPEKRLDATIRFTCEDLFSK